MTPSTLPSQSKKNQEYKAWEWAVLDRAAELLKLAVTQGCASVEFEVLAGGTKTQRMVARLLPAWRILGQDEVRPVDEGEFGAIQLVVCLAATGEAVCRFKPVQSIGFTVANGAATLNLPGAWWVDDFQGVAAWCWGAVVSSLQAGETVAHVSLPVSGDDSDEKRVDLVCRLTADLVSRQFFVTVIHARTGALIGCTNPVYLGDEVQDDGAMDWGIGHPWIDPMGD